MEQKMPAKTFFIAALSAVIGYLSYTQSDLTAGIITTFMAGWILFQFRGAEKAWGSLGNFQNPILFGINIAFAAYIYATWQRIPGQAALQISVGMFLIGGALSLLISKYWNMGP
ncbi:MAG: hypothetical protein ABEK16_04355 [Candidatus Nanohalobium sp.]